MYLKPPAFVGCFYHTFIKSNFDFRSPLNLKSQSHLQSSQTGLQNVTLLTDFGVLFELNFSITIFNGLQTEFSF